MAEIKIEKKYLDLEGLTTYDTKIKAHIAEEDAKKVNKNPKASVHNLGAYKIATDENGLVVEASDLRYEDLQNTPTIGNGVLTIKAGGTKKGEFSANETANKEIDITAADLGLSAALVFVGISSTDPTGESGATVAGHTTWKAGDVVLYNAKEYVLTATPNIGANWVELGDEGSFVLKTTKVTGTNGLTGGGALSSNIEISHAQPAKSVEMSDVAPQAILVDTYGHIIDHRDISVEATGAHIHTISGSGSAWVPVYTPTEANLKFSKTFATVPNVTGAASSHLAQTTILGVTGSTVEASKATAGDAITYGKADVGAEKTIENTTASLATIVDAQEVIGTANVASPKSFGVTAVAAASTVSTQKYAYDASYDSANYCLNLTPLTLSTEEIQEATYASERTLSNFVTFSTVGVAAATAPIKFTPAVPAAASQTFTPYTFSKVDVPVASTTPTTVATGKLTAAVQGDAVVTGITNGDPFTVVKTAELESASDGTIKYISAVTEGSKEVSITNITGTAQSAGEHEHTLS